VQAESFAAAWRLYKATGDETYRNDYNRIWQWCWEHMIDHQYGAWFRVKISSGIVHFGIGNFHRAHQAIYCEDLLERGDSQWGITGVSLRSSAMRDDLRPQDYLYTLAILGERTEFRCIGAIQNVLVAPQH